MTAADKGDLVNFGLERRTAVAQEAGCDVSKVGSGVEVGQIGPYGHAVRNAGCDATR